jgi:hypothetical protein
VWRVSCEIAIDEHSGTLYVTWSDFRNCDVDVFLSRSTDQGLRWSPPLRVNDDPIHNGADPFYQWLAVDPTGGDVYVQFYDRRRSPWWPTIRGAITPPVRIAFLIES